MQVKACWSAAIAAGIGLVAWRGNLLLIGLAGAIPTLLFTRPSRLEAFGAGFAYYAAASWPIVPGVLDYFAPSGTILQAFLSWALPSLVLPLAWVAYWRRGARGAYWRVPLAYLLSVAPPLGMIGWACPLTAAGILFPGWGWGGLVAMVALTILAMYRPPEAAWLLVVLALMGNVDYPGDLLPPTAWEAVNTSFDRISDPVDPMPEFRTAQCLRRMARASDRKVIVFPESMVPRWTDATEYLWRNTIDEIRAKGKTILFGAGLPISGKDGYRNAVLVVGKTTTAAFLQRVPVPAIMWNPLVPELSVPMHPFGPSVLEVAGERVAILICYEQLLAWPILQSAVHRPTLIVGVANDNWARGTPIPAAQRAAVTAWARLFRLPKIIAVNL
jgi:Carbon-nitrogen hydrolase